MNAGFRFVQQALTKKSDRSFLPESDRYSPVISHQLLVASCY
ncbi:MAG: hypothetical protein ACM37W_18610 [Actinomycetota bacterium]